MSDPTAPDRSELGRLARAWLPIPAAAGLIAIVVLASRTTSVLSSPVAIDARFVLTAIEVVAYVAVAVGLVLLPAIVLFRLRQRRLRAARPARERVPWWARIGGLVLALGILAAQLAAIAVIAYLAPRLWRIEGSGATDGQLDPLGLDPNALEAPGRDATSIVIALVIVVALAVAALAVAIRWRLSDDSRPAEPSDEVMPAQAVEVSLDALRREPDPRRAIIAAYAAMERSMSHAGLGRQPAEAPLEYLRRVLVGAFFADAADVRTMTRLFEVAKFSQHAVDEAMRARAIAALERIRAAMARHA